MHIQLIAVGSKKLRQDIINVRVLSNHCKRHADQLVAQHKLAHVQLLQPNILLEGVATGIFCQQPQ